MTKGSDRNGYLTFARHSNAGALLVLLGTLLLGCGSTESGAEPTGLNAPEANTPVVLPEQLPIPMSPAAEPPQPGEVATVPAEAPAEPAPMSTAAEPAEMPEQPEPAEVPTPEPAEMPTPEPAEMPTPEPAEMPTPAEPAPPEPAEMPTPEPAEMPTPAEPAPPEPAEMPTPEPVDPVLRIMPMGDSITYGGRRTTNGGYRGPLYNMLSEAGYEMQFVGSSQEGIVSTRTNPLPAEQRSHNGHSSYNITDIHNNLDGLDTRAFDRHGGTQRDPHGGYWFLGIPDGRNMRPPEFPDIITLMVGTNNANDGNRNLVRTQLIALMDKITTLRPETDLIVAQITPSNRPNNPSFNAMALEEALALAAMGRRISVVDMFSDFPDNGMSTDNVHPVDAGFEFMARQWFEAIVETPNAKLRAP